MVMTSSVFACALSPVCKEPSAEVRRRPLNGQGEEGVGVPEGCEDATVWCGQYAWKVT